MNGRHIREGHRDCLPRLEAAGLDAWLVRGFAEIDEANIPWLAALTRDCECQFGEALIDLVPSYTTLLVVFDPMQLTPQEAADRLQSLIAALEPNEETASGEIREILTWYDPSVGPELARLADRAGMSVDEVIVCHSERLYRVFALGFAPGFAFMGLVDSRLACPRLASPRQRVPQGSVAVADRQTAAYPLVTPGGWNLIGRTSATLFDRDIEGFSLLRPGDRVRFVPVDRGEFERQGGDITPLGEGR